MFKIQALILVTLLTFTNDALSQAYPKWDNQHIYLVGRSTSFKAGVIAKEFNIKDTMLTHIGLGIFINDTFKIYNVSNSDQNNDGSNLLCQSIEEFTSISDILELKIFKKKVTKDKRNELIRNIRIYEHRKIVFDEAFLYQNSDSLYCSEFVFNILKEVKIIKTPRVFFKTKTLSPFQRYALKRDELFYIPVDFFLLMDKIKMNFKKEY